MKVANNQADGFMALGHNKGCFNKQTSKIFLVDTLNYYPNSFDGSKESIEKRHQDSKWKIETSDVDRHDDSEIQNYEQPRAFWEKVKYFLKNISNEFKALYELAFFNIAVACKRFQKWRFCYIIT